MEVGSGVSLLIILIAAVDILNLHLQATKVK
jgi:hypothetical protein